MNQLKVIADEMLPVYETSTGEKVVNGRELHEQLFVARDFPTWIQDRIRKYGFKLNEDFSTFRGKSNGGRPTTEYLLLLDTAKEIAMVENNEQGRVIRKYFIEVEKEHRKQNQPQSIEDLIIMQAQNMKDIRTKLENQGKQLETVNHRLDNYDKIDQIGDLQQRLNNMVRKYAAQNGIAFPEAWRHFTKGFNNAYRTNLKSLIKHYKEKHGLKNLTAPQYLSMAGRLEDAVRVADKMLNQQAILTSKELV
ncbi:antA/AntB antirepressor family protein [Virgibacillus oceani]